MGGRGSGGGGKGGSGGGGGAAPASAGPNLTDRQASVLAAAERNGFSATTTYTGEAGQRQVAADDLRRMGLLKKIGNSYYLTDAGRAELARRS